MKISVHCENIDDAIEKLKELKEVYKKNNKTEIENDLEDGGRLYTEWGYIESPYTFIKPGENK